MSNQPKVSCDSSAPRLVDMSVEEEMEDMRKRLSRCNVNLNPPFSLQEAIEAGDDYHNFHVIDFSPGPQCSAMLNGGATELLAEPFSLRTLAGKAKYEIKPAGAKGLGMFATANIPARAPIIVEHPVLVVPSSPSLSVPSSVMFEVLFNRLELPVKKELLTLANCKSPELYDQLEGIARTNMFGIELSVPRGQDSEYRGLFLKTSRCNHSCNPNTTWAWSAETFALTLSALRPIRAGEEITLTYVERELVGNERRGKLKNSYRIDCDCSLCRPPDDTPSRSHARLMASLCEGPRFRDWCLDPTMPVSDVLNAQRRCLAIIEQEKLPFDLRLVYLLDILSCYIALGKADHVRMFARGIRDEYAGRDPEWAQLDRWIASPESHPLWKLREKILAAHTLPSHRLT